MLSRASDFPSFLGPQILSSAETSLLAHRLLMDTLGVLTFLALVNSTTVHVFVKLSLETLRPAVWMFMQEGTCCITW